MTRSAVAAGVAWTVPVVTSLPASAAAASSSLPCNTYYGVRMTLTAAHSILDPLESWPDPDLRYKGTPHEQRLGLCPEVEQWLADHPDSGLVMPPPDKLPKIVASSDGNMWAAVLPPGILANGADNCRLLLAWARAEQYCCEGKGDPSPPDPTQAGRRILFPQCEPLPRAQIHSLTFIYCCP